MFILIMWHDKVCLKEIQTNKKIIKLFRAENNVLHLKQYHVILKNKQIKLISIYHIIYA